MNIVQLKEGLENGTITIDYKGHSVDSIFNANSILRYVKCDVDHNQKFREEIKSGKALTHDYILVTVKPGTWQIDHFYDFEDEDDDPTIYSKLYLKK